MRITTESSRARWVILLAAWIVVAFLLSAHAAARRDYIDVLNRLGLRGASAPRTPLRQVIPARYADAHQWVRHAIAAHEGGTARLRFITSDNAPHGREVHWSSTVHGLLGAAASFERRKTDASAVHAIERAVLWLNVPLLLVLVIGLSAWVAARAGAPAGVVVALGMVGHPRFYEGFAPAYVDHHGLINAATLGLLLGLAFMGAGWRRATDANGADLWPTSLPQMRRAAFLSAVCGAIGLWLSAAAMIPAIALAGAGGLIAAWRSRRGAETGAVFEPGVWRLWGRVGAATSVACYLLEYAPAHLGLRLEANHPLYALAWWGGGELIATIAAWRSGAPRPFRAVAPQLFLPALAVAATPVTILLGGTAVFMVGDPFVGALRHFVAEGRSLAATLRLHGIGSVGYELTTTALLALPLWLVVRRRGGAVLCLLTVVATGFTVMALLEMRWWLSVSAAQIALLVGVLATIGRTEVTRWVAAGAAASVLFLAPAIARIARDRAENRAQIVAAGDLLEPLYRDIAAALRETQPAGDLVMLASPNASAGIGYYGQFKTLGTLYWENAPGLRAAAEIFSAGNDDDALRLLRGRGVTHVVMISAANFLGEYFQLLHPDRDLAEAKNAFGFRLAAGGAAPRWLRPIPYRVPPELKDATPRVALYQVAPEQSEIEWRYHTAVAQVAAGDIVAGEQMLQSALAQAPAQARPAICEAAGAAFYDFGADAAAARVFRRGLESGPSPGMAATLAWILATSADTSIRDGRAALAIVEPQLRAAPDDASVLSTFAAACAEVGRFREAVAAAERALALANAAGDVAAMRLLQQRQETYRAGRPWRQ